MPVTKHRYLCALKQKAGEFDAVRELAPAVWARWNPLFELLSLDPDDSTDQTEADNLIAKCVHGLRRSCRQGTTIFLDFDGMELLGPHAARIVEQILMQVAAQGIQPVPVLSLGSSQSVVQGAAAFIAGNEKCCAVRLFVDDLNPSPATALSQLLTQVGLHAEQCHLILDLEYLPQEQVPTWALTLPIILPTVPMVSEWATITLLATGVPQILNIPSASNSVLNRTELELFNLVRNQIAPSVRRLDFGDYAVSNPVSTDFDPRTMQVCPKIFYTTQNGWITYKGRSTRRHGWDQCHQMCQQLSTDPGFQGQMYSAGDAYISNCATRAVSSGNGRTWKKVGTNHHITLVADQIANLPGF